MKKKSRRDAQKNRPPNNHRQLYASVCLTRSLEVLALRLVPHVGRARRREVLAPLLAAELERAAPAGRGQARANPEVRARGHGAVQVHPSIGRPPLLRAAAVRGRARGDGAGNDDTYMCGVCVFGESFR